jgi:hypothetical protein
MKSKKEGLDGKFFVICDESTERNTQDLTQLGPFDSVKRAEKAIMDDAENSMDDMDGLELGRNEEYGSLYYIVQAVRVVKPVPVISAEIELMPIIPDKVARRG